MISEVSEPGNLPNIKVLIIEDDFNSGKSIVDALEKSNIRTVWATTMTEGLQLKSEFLPDIVLLNLDLPDRPGVDAVNHLAQQRESGVIVVSGLTDVANRIAALELGADDYVVKPPVFRELVARIRAVNRRFAVRPVKPSQAAGPAPMKAGTLNIDPANHAVYGANGARIAVTSAEFIALKALIDAKGEAVPRSHISTVALNHAWQSEDRSVDQLIYNLRRKLLAGGDATVIASVRGEGYLIAQS